jgi:histidinol-phosphate aminotransferase
MAAEAAKTLQLYSDPECRALKEQFTKVFGIPGDRVLFTNGSDETLYFLFLAFCDEEHGAAFPALSYGFYPVYADFTHTPSLQIPLREDFTIDPADYFGLGRTVIIANPNAPTGVALTRDQIESIVRANPDNVVAVDEAYVDFGAESCLPLIDRYDNLLVIQTFSKSRSMAGARLGFGIACESLIRDLNTIRYSTNPYNVNSMTPALGLGTLLDPEYTKRNCAEIVRVREETAERLRALGFTLTESRANFLFARSKRIGGEALYRRLKDRGILVRHFDKPRIRDYNRITVGTPAQMEALLTAIQSILEETT